MSTLYYTVTWLATTVDCDSLGYGRVQLVNFTSHNWFLSQTQQLKYTVSQKNCAKLFLSELRQISTDFDNFWQKDGKEATIIRDALIAHLI